MPEAVYQVIAMLSTLVVSLPIGANCGRLHLRWLLVCGRTEPRTAGRPGFITADYIRPGAVVIDFGINVLPDGQIVGDVDDASARQVAGAITPVPGGTELVTNALLARNCLLAAQRQRRDEERDQQRQARLSRRHAQDAS